MVVEREVTCRIAIFVLRNIGKGKGVQVLEKM
jgi:hypothetical protein